MNAAPEIDNAWRAPGEVGKAENKQTNRTVPVSTGQCGQVLHLIRQHVLSLRLTADCAIPEAAARVHDLRAAAWNVLTSIHPTVIFRGEAA